MFRSRPSEKEFQPWPANVCIQLKSLPATKRCQRFMGSWRSWFNYLPRQLFWELQPLNIPLLEMHCVKHNCCQARAKRREHPLTHTGKQTFSLQQQVTLVALSVWVCRADRSQSAPPWGTAGHSSSCSPHRRAGVTLWDHLCQEMTALLSPCMRVVARGMA